MGRKTSSSPVSWGKAGAQYAIAVSGPLTLPPAATNTNPPKCCDGAAGRLCSACVCCVCCPLALAWGCIWLPCKAGWRAAKQARKWVGGRYEERPLAYSSFSDIDSNSEASN